MKKRHDRENGLHKRVVAVIDIGSTALRMTIAQINGPEKITILETLQQGISLGRDTFTMGYLHRSSIEECVKALKSFKQTLDEYGISNPEQIRIVATTAVREALNRDMFLDRILIANNMKVEVIDDADLSRINYLSVRSCLDGKKIQRTPGVMVAEISGGSTEILFLQDMDVIFSRTYRLGALRLREALELFRTAMPRKREIMTSDIIRTVQQISDGIPKDLPVSLLIQGNDARLAALRLIPEWNLSDPVKIQLSALSRFTESILSLNADELVHTYHISYADAETLGPSLLFYTELAKKLNLKSILVTDISVRHGLLVEMSLDGKWSEDFTRQVIRSANGVGRKYNFNSVHCNHVAYLASLLFKELQNEHRLEPWFEVLLRVAALLHDIGLYISTRNHHKHSMYLIENSELFGLSRRDILIAALTARYHRRSPPKVTHEIYSSLDRNTRLIVSKLAAILRIADALDRSDKRRIRTFTCSRDKDVLIINVPEADDFTLEQMGIQSKENMFEEIYGMSVVIQNSLTAPENA